MTPERWAKVKETFEAALAVAGPDRAALLHDRCAGDPELRAEVESLLGEEQEARAFLGKPAHTAFLSELAEAMRAPAPPHGLVAGAKVGDFRIIELIGAGGMGEVYLAEQEHPRRRVALKVLRGGFLSPSAIRRFEFESQVLARLQHPGIAQIYEAGTFAGGQPFFAMELVEGVPITQFAARLPVPGRLRLFALACEAVQHAHAKGVIHRDIKPSNILVGEDGRPRILDFGVARISTADKGATMGTGTGQIIGTLGYMSPEQVSGDPHEVDTRSDIYALGVLLFELLGGHAPFDFSETSLPEAIRIITERDPPRLGSLDPQLRGDPETIVAKAMDKDRTRRYQTAAELAADVERYMTDRPITARPVSAIYQLRKFTRRNQALVGGVIVTCVVLVIGIISTTWQAVRATRGEAIARRQVDIGSAFSEFTLVDFPQMLEEVPGTLEARHVLVEKGTQYLDALASDAGSSPRVLRNLAVGYAALGDIQGNPYHANLGDAAGAERSYQKALDAAEKLARLPGATPDERRQAPLIRLRLGDVAVAIGRTGEALNFYLTALDGAKAIAAVAPDNVPVQIDLVTLYGRRCEIQAGAGRQDLAQDAFDAASEVQARLAAMAVSSPEVKRGLAQSHMVMGNALEHAGRSGDALAEYERQLSVAREIADENPGNAEDLGSLSIALNYVGNTLMKLGRHADALARFEEALGIDDSLARADPANLQAQRDLATTLSKVGHALHASGRYDDAMSCFTRCLEILEQHRGSGTQSSHAQSRMAICHEQIGDTLIAQSRPADAVAAYARSIDIRRHLADADPGNEGVRRDLGACFEKLGTAHAAMQHWADAADAYRASLNLRRPIAGAHPEDGAIREAIELCETLLGALPE